MEKCQEISNIYGYTEPLIHFFFFLSVLSLVHYLSLEVIIFNTISKEKISFVSSHQYFYVGN